MIVLAVAAFVQIHTTRLDGVASWQTELLAYCIAFMLAFESLDSIRPAIANPRFTIGAKQTRSQSYINKSMQNYPRMSHQIEKDKIRGRIRTIGVVVNKYTFQIWAEISRYIEVRK
jgi:hypothetical protein